MRTAKGQGSLYRITTKNGTEAYVYRRRWTDEDGEKHDVRAQALTATEAIRRFEKKIKALDAPDTQTPRKKPAVKNPRTLSGDLTLEQYLKLWSPQRDVQPDSRHKEYRHIEMYIIPSVRGKSLKQITPKQLQTIFTNISIGAIKTLQGKQLGLAGQKSVYQSLNTLLNYAVKAGHIRSNPLASIKKPQPLSKDDVAIAKERIEVSKAVAESFVLGERYSVYDELRFRVALLGLRPSEALGLTWDCIDFDDREILVKQQLARYDTWEDGDGYYLKPRTKNRRPRRVPMSYVILALFQEWQVTQDKKKQHSPWRPEPGFENLVFTDENGRHITQKKDRAHWRRILKDRNLEAFSIGKLRSVGVILARQSSLPAEQIAKMFGHSTAVEDRYYNFAQMEHLRQAVEAQEEALNPSSPEVARIRKMQSLGMRANARLRVYQRISGQKGSPDKSLMSASTSKSLDLMS